MTTEIAETTPGRGLARYDLADEVADLYNLNHREAHEAITALLADLINEDPNLILGRRPMRPELLNSSAPDVDRYHWLTVSDETAEITRGALAATYGTGAE